MGGRLPRCIPCGAAPRGHSNDSYPPRLSPGPGPVWVEEIPSPEVAPGLCPTPGGFQGLGWLFEWRVGGLEGPESGLLPGILPSWAAGDNRGGWLSLVLFGTP